MHRLAFAVVLALAAASCGGDSATSEQSQFPTGSVRSWFDALEANETAAALALTYEDSMLVVLAAENALPLAESASLLRRGATDESAERYISSFAAALRERYGASLSDVTVDGFSQLGDIYAAVTVTGEGSASIVTRRAPGGLWQVDMVGTLGPALIAQLRDLLDLADDGPDGDVLRDAYRADVLPALQAAALNDPENLGLASEMRVMDSLLRP